MHLASRIVQVGAHAREVFELLPDEGKVDDRRERPSDDSDHEGRPDESSESSSDSGDDIGPEHLPGGTDIFHEFLEARSFDRIDESLELLDLVLSHGFDRILFLISHLLDLGFLGN